MKVFIVHAHHEPNSFSGALTREAVVALRNAGHEVQLSDLYAMNFDPVSDRRNFVSVKDPSHLKQQVEEEHASQVNGFAPELQAEMDKLTWSDTVILQFPLWWLGMPAILKGWIDRVFAAGWAYGGGRFFSRGVFNGKRAICSVTVGGSALMYSDAGAYGSLQRTLFPIHHGILNFVGFTVLEPFVVHSPARLSHQERLSHLRRYRERVLHLDSEIPMPGLDLANYDGLVVRPELQRRA